MDFDIKRHVMKLLESKDRSTLRPKSMDMDAFLR